MTVYTDFTHRDFSSNYERLLSLLSQEVPEYTDRNHSDAGIAIIRLLARQTDMLSFYIDEAFIESFISTARFMQSLIDLGTLVDVRPKLSSPASSTLQVTRLILDDGTAPLTIAAHSEFSRGDGIVYTNVDEVVIPINQRSATFPVVQGRFVTIAVVDSDFSKFDQFTRLSINLGAGVATGYTLMESADPEFSWEEVDTFYRSMASSRHFMLELYADAYEDTQNTVFLSIGDGIYGDNVIPVDGLDVTYLVTDGALGNGGINTITTAPGGLYTCTNTTICNGGSSVETVEEFRRRLPRVVRTQRRGLSTEDYSALVLSIPGVSDCQAVDRGSSTNWPYMYVFLYVLPEGGGVVSEQLRTQVMNSCKDWGHLGAWGGRYIIKDSIEDTTPVTISVGLSPGAAENVVDTAIRAALVNLFDPSVQRLGENLLFTTLYTTVSRVSGVEWVQFVTPDSSVLVAAGHILVLGAVEITYV